MSVIISSMILIATIISLMMMMALMISKKTHMDREKSSPFECGFDPKSSARMPFSLHFFLIGVIFLIFDIEITLMIPLIFMMKSISIITFFIYSSLFFMILLLGTYHEWSQGALDWQI